VLLFFFPFFFFFCTRQALQSEVAPKVDEMRVCDRVVLVGVGGAVGGVGCYNRRGWDSSHALAQRLLGYISSHPA